MSRLPRARRTAASLAPYALAAIGGVFAVWLSVYSVGVVLPWRRPVQNWMTAHGLGAWAGHYGLFNLHIPGFILSCVGGAVVGALSGSRWRSRIVVFSVAYCAHPTVTTLYWFGLWGWSLSLLVLMLNFSVFPLAIASAWLASRPKRRREWRMAVGRCQTCGYDLRASKDKCPECATPVPKQETVAR